MSNIPIECPTDDVLFDDDTGTVHVFLDPVDDPCEHPKTAWLW